MEKGIPQFNMILLVVNTLLLFVIVSLLAYAIFILPESINERLLDLTVESVVEEDPTGGVDLEEEVVPTEEEVPYDYVEDAYFEGMGDSIASDFAGLMVFSVIDVPYSSAKKVMIEGDGAYYMDTIYTVSYNEDDVVDGVAAGGTSYLTVEGDDYKIERKICVCD